MGAELPVPTTELQPQTQEQEVAQRPVAQTTMDVEVGRIPSQTITLEEYKRKNGMEVAPQATGFTADQNRVTGAVGGSEQTFAYNASSRESRSRHGTSRTE